MFELWKSNYKLLFTLTIYTLSFMILLPALAFAGVDEWTGNGPECVWVRSIAVSPDYATDYTVFAGTSRWDIGGGVYKSTDGGQSWSQNGLTHLDIHSIAISPNYTTDHTVFIGAFDNNGMYGGVYKSTDGGQSWAQTDLVGYDIRFVAVSPNYSMDHTIFASTNRFDQNGGVYKSTDGGQSWAQTDLVDMQVTSIAISPNYTNDHTIFASTSSQGVYKSTDGGQSWTKTGLNDGLIYSIAVSPNYEVDCTIFVGGVGIYKSTDDGRSWIQAGDGFTNAYIESLALSPDYTLDRTIFAGTYNNSGGVYKSTDGGQSWTKTSFPMDNDIPTLVTSPNYTADRTVFAGTWGSGVFSRMFLDMIPPITILSTCPTSVDIVSGWFRTTPTINLSSSEPGVTYYKWNNESVQTYSSTFVAREGINTLYYWSVDNAYNIEMIRSQVFRVDVQAPSAPSNLRITRVADAQIDFAWDSSTDNLGLAGYCIYNAATDDTITTVSSACFSHQGLAPDAPYTYYIKAFDDAGNFSDKSNIISARTSSGPVATPTGPNVSVTLANNISLVFDNVTTAGETSATVMNNPPVGPPSGFRFRGYYIDISTTATYSGDILVTIPYDPSLITGSENNLKLFHHNGQNWEDVTISVDTVNSTITGRTTSLSPFVVGEAEQQSSQVPASSILSLASIAISGLLILKRSLARVDKN